MGTDLKPGKKMIKPGLIAEDQKKALFIGFIIGISTLLNGGFHIFSSAIVSIIMGICLIKMLIQKKKIYFYLNYTSLAVILILLGYLITVFWAIDHGMAAFGFVKFLPVLLYLMLLMQMKQEGLQQIYRIIPALGSFITVISGIAILIPSVSGTVLINGRLAGTFQYANTYALFLLVGYIVLLFLFEKNWNTLILELVLSAGIFASGSRTTMALLIVIMLVYFFNSRDPKEIIKVILPFAAAGILAVLISRLGIVEANRSISSFSEPSTLYCRLLYFKDAVPVILKHPFGLGYFGYYTLQSSFQTGVYSVRFVHNEFLQLLLDVGWIPAGVLCSALCRNFFRKGKSLFERVILFTLLAHSMMDFDFQFISIWFLLIPALDIHRGWKSELHRHRIPVCSSLVCVVLLSIWMGTSDAFYNLGMQPVCLRMTPFYTIAWEDELSQADNVKDAGQIADQILVLTDYLPSAHNAKGNVALSDGNIAEMMQEKEIAIRLSPFYLDAYCNYFDLLYDLRNKYLETGDEKSAELCRQKMKQIPEELEKVKANADALAWKLEHKPALDLPDSYKERLLELT